MCGSRQRCGRSWQTPRCASLIAGALGGCQGCAVPHPPPRGSASAEVPEALAFAGQPLEKRGRRPRLAVASVEGGHIRVHLLETHLIGVEHGTATVAREAVAVEVGHVDVARPERDALLEDARTFVDERPQAALDDLVVADLPALDAAFLRAGGDDGLHRGVGLGCPAPGVVAIPARAR